MSRVTVNEQYLQDTADAIREKTGSSDTYKPSQFASAIADISSGGNENYTVTITLYNPSSSSSFVSCIIYEYIDGTPYQIGTIASPTGSVVVTVDSIADHIRIALEGSYVGVPLNIGASPLGCFMWGNIGYKFGDDGGYMQFIVHGDGGIDIYGIDWSD